MIYAITLAFTKPPILDFSLSRYYATYFTGLSRYYAGAGMSATSAIHYVLDQHYPGVSREEVKAVSDKYGCTYLDAGKNLGLHHGFNWVTAQIPNLKSSDIIIGYDHDVNPISQGWLAAIQSAMVDPEIGWVCLNIPAIHDVQCAGQNLVRTIEASYDDETHDYLPKVNYLVLGKPTVNSVCGFKWDFLQKIGGLQEPNNWYGGLEAHMWNGLIKLGYRWAILLDYCEKWTPEIVHEPSYTEYKTALACDFSTTLDYESWLKKKDGKN